MATFPWADVTVDWPGFGLGADSDVSRTQLEDGATRQAKTADRVFDTRTIGVNVTYAKLARVREWFRTNAAEFFTFRDIDGTDRQVRVRGGFGAVNFVAAAGRLRLDGDRYLRAEIELEGYW